jgi:hypothetical protein
MSKKSDLPKRYLEGYKCPDTGECFRHGTQDDSPVCSSCGNDAGTGNVSHQVRVVLQVVWPKYWPLTLSSPTYVEAP